MRKPYFPHSLFFSSIQFTRKKEGCHIAKSIKSIPIRQTKDYTKKQSNFNKNEIRFLFWKTLPRVDKFQYFYLVNIKLDYKFALLLKK